MRFFDPEHHDPDENLVKPEKVEPDSQGTSSKYPAESEVLVEIGLVLLICLGLAAVVDLLMRFVSAH